MRAEVIRRRRGVERVYEDVLGSAVVGEVGDESENQSVFATAGFYEDVRGDSERFQRVTKAHERSKSDGFVVCSFRGERHGWGGLPKPKPSAAGAAAATTNSSSGTRKTEDDENTRRD